MKKLFCILSLIIGFIPLFSQDIFHQEIEAYFNPALKPFYFGVASGDPQPNGIVLWTKDIY